MDQRCRQNDRLTGKLGKARFAAEHIGATTNRGVRFATTRNDFANCYRLIYKTYLHYGYTKLSPHELRANFWNALPATYTLIAEKNGHLEGTLTCVMDSEAGLPIDSFSSLELQKLRQEGRRLCELSGLAVNSQHAEATTILRLFRYALALTTGFLNGSDFVITVHPRHAGFYKEVVLFEELARKQQYPQVNGAPGVLLRLDLETMQERYFQTYGGRKAGKDLHELYFIKDQEQIAQSIGRGLEERQRQLDQQMLLKLLSEDTQVINCKHSLRAIQRQWAAWYRAQQPSCALSHSRI